MVAIDDNILRKLFSYFGPYKFLIFLAALALIVTAGSILSYGFLARKLVDEAAAGAANYNDYFVAFLCISAALAISGFFRSYLVNSIAFDVVTNLRKQVFAKCLDFPIKFFDNNGSQILSNAIIRDLENIFNIFTKNITFFLRNILLFVSGFVLMMIVSIKLFSIMLLSFVLLSLPIFVLVKSFKSAFAKYKNLDSNYSEFISQSLHFIKLVKSSNAQSRIAEDVANFNYNLSLIFRQKILMQSLMIAVAILFSFSAIAIILFFGADAINNNKLAVGEFTSFIFNAVISSVALVGLAQSLAQIIKISRSATDCFKILSDDSEDLDKGELLNLDDYQNIALDNVSFSYPCKQEKILDNLSMNIAVGSKTIINAPSGSGKSTIFSLLLRFYEIDSGSIKFDNKSISGFKISSLRDNIYFTMQESFLLTGSVYENLTFPNVKLSKGQIQKIIDSESCLEFINKLPSGIDTNIGSHGAKLSGGQKQRIAILRALISNAKLLIFDESMSQLDSDNEKEVFSLIEKMRSGRTVVFVSHKSHSNFSYDKVIDL